ncbi:hypothetical protein F6Y05_41250 [Bacillus megaterium]|nr:hypothetical protein [Priestia megaterium NBRC 15308 = ATCC 14581]NGY89342.1 hypothetical protein [Priestia megaterium]
MGRYLQEVLYALNYQINDSFNVSLIVPEKLDPIYEEKFNNINFIRARKIPHPMWEQYTIPSFLRRANTICCIVPITQPHYQLTLKK